MVEEGGIPPWVEGRVAGHRLTLATIAPAHGKVGPGLALLAALAHAMPPLVHATLPAPQSVPHDRMDLARMTGCSWRQTLWKVELPVTMPVLAIGLNQVVMLTRNMVRRLPAARGHAVMQ